MARALLLGCASVSQAYGVRMLFEDLSFGLFEGDHAGPVGPNGSGKHPATFACTLVPMKARGAPRSGCACQPSRFSRRRQKTSLSFFVWNVEQLTPTSWAKAAGFSSELLHEPGRVPPLSRSRTLTTCPA